VDVTRGHEYRLDWIVSFVAVAEHHGFSAAASALYRSQPRVSVQVAELEHALGVRLFDRSTHPARLTAQGRALLPHAEAMLSNLRTLCDTAARSDGAPRGEVRVGLYPSAAVYLLPRVLELLGKNYPDVHLTLCEGSTLELEDALLGGGIELAVRPLMPQPRSAKLGHATLWREPLVALVPEQHPLAGRRSVTMADLGDAPLVTIGETQSPQQAQFETLHAFAQAGISPSLAMQTNQPQTLVALVRGGFGVGVTNSMAIAVSKLDGVRPLSIRDAHCDRQVAAWWRTDQPESAAQRAVRDTMATVPAPQWEWAGRAALAPVDELTCVSG
jgi:DNA-binding transcriptional LysR family regulator